MRISTLPSAHEPGLFFPHRPGVHRLVRLQLPLPVERDSAAGVHAVEHRPRRRFPTAHSVHLDVFVSSSSSSDALNSAGHSVERPPRLSASLIA